MRTLRSRGEAAGSLADTLAASVKTLPAPPPAMADAGARGGHVSVRVPVKPGATAIEMVAADVVDALKKAPPPLYATSNAGEGIQPDLVRITQTIYAVDAFKDYDDLEKNLEVGEERGDYKTLTEHLDKAERRARRAHALYLGAKLELVKWELDQKRVQGAMRASAKEELEEEKLAGEKKKQITNADVEDKMVEKFPDEMAHHALTAAKLKGTVDHLEVLAGLWKTKCFSLGTLLTTLRK